MTSGHSTSLGSDSKNFHRGKLRSGLICLALAGITALPLFATVDPGEIVQSSVTATVGTTFDPINGVSVTFRWTTQHPGNSIVIIENSTDYAGDNNTPTRQVVQNDNTTNHVVVVDRFPAYSGAARWGYYVASAVNIPRCSVTAAVCHAIATYPGPATAGCGSGPFPGCGGTYLWFDMPTSPTNPNGPLAFTMWPIGGQNLYEGDPTQSPVCDADHKLSRECNDLYIALQPNLMSGPIGSLIQMQDVVITNLDTGRVVTDGSLTARYLCNLSAPSNPPPNGWDGSDPTIGCYGGTTYSINSTLRIRAKSNAVPGHYQYTGNFQPIINGQNNGSPVVVTYNFTVLPTASFTATPPTTFPPIARQSTWQNDMVNPAPYSGQGAPYRSGEWWCTNNTDTNPWWSLDNGNFQGEFDIPASIYFEAWNYDGGRVYTQIADYSYNTQNLPDQGYHNDAQRQHWERCAELAMEPYKDATIASLGGFVREPNQFPYGMEMNYLRTGDATNQAAVNVLATNPAWGLYYSGNVFAEATRVSAYLVDDRLAAEMVGTPRDPNFLLRSIDVLLGYLDQSYNLNFSNPNQQAYDIHPFTVGVAMEALITYYELDLAEGNTPDARIPLEIKKTLDWEEATQYIPSTHLLAYQPYDLPMNPQLVGGGLYGATELNDLISPAFAWYWSKSNNVTYLNEGDDLFNHVFDDAGGNGGPIGGGWTYSVKEFTQIYKWSFDYVRWRTGQNPDGTPAIETVLPAANPCDNPNQNPCNAPWVDNTTPVSYQWVSNGGNGYPVADPVIANPVVTATTATFTVSMFKPLSTLTVYYGTATPGTCNLSDPAPPECMQPFPNFGYLNMLNANYANHSATVTDTQDLIALGMGIPNVYDAAVTVTGLLPNTTYHWRPFTEDSLGNMAASHDLTFTTPAH